MVLIWFYCDGRSERRKTDARYIFGSLYRQLFEVNHFTGAVAHLEHFQNCERKTTERKIGLVFVANIVHICQRLKKTVYILIDGIDESPEAGNLSMLILQLVKDSTAVKVLVTCRPETDIEAQFINCPRIEITEVLLTKDIDIHLQWNLDFDPKLKQMRERTKKEIKKQLLDQHQGMYLS